MAITITNELKEKALRIGKKANVKVIFVNDSGEFFTDEQFAKLSVKADKDRYISINVSDTTTDTDTSDTAKIVIANIKSLTDLSAVLQILDSEKEGKNRATVIAAAEAKIAELENIGSDTAALIAEINASADMDFLNDMLELENEGEKREDVIAALTEKINALKK